MVVGRRENPEPGGDFCDFRFARLCGGGCAEVSDGAGKGLRCRSSAGPADRAGGTEAFGAVELREIRGEICAASQDVSGDEESFPEDEVCLEEGIFKVERADGVTAHRGARRRGLEVE